MLIPPVTQKIIDYEIDVTWRTTDLEGGVGAGVVVD